MFFGRNEEEGLRCVYHGWKFDVTGRCTDLPNSSEGPTYKDKVKITSYPCEDKGDLIWAYMGPAEKKPEFPEFEWTKLPKSHRYVTKFVEQCNYLQAMEGDYDPSHARFLHSTLDANASNPGIAVRGAMTPGSNIDGPVSSEEPFPRAVGNRRVTTADARLHETKLVDHDQAMISVLTQQQADGRYSSSVGATWWMPIFCTAGIAKPYHSSSNMRIPIDNESLMFYRLRWSWEPISDEDLAEYKHGGYTHPELIPGSWMPKANLQNDYLIDRVAQKHLTYSGIKTFPLQDIALIEAQWGPIAKRQYEHLVKSDFMIIHVRQRLLRAAKELMNGIEPVGPSRPEVYRFHREVAVADTAEEAERKATEQALRPLLGEKLKVAVTA